MIQSPKLGGGGKGVGVALGVIVTVKVGSMVGVALGRSVAEGVEVGMSVVVGVCPMVGVTCCCSAVGDAVGPVSLISCSGAAEAVVVTVGVSVGSVGKPVELGRVTRIRNSVNIIPSKGVRMIIFRLLSRDIVLCLYRIRMANVFLIEDK